MNELTGGLDEMVAKGFVDEVRGLLHMRYSPDLKSMQSIGYLHIVEYPEGSLSWDETVWTLKRDTRRYAKHQLTWFQADPGIVWTGPGEYDKIHGLVKNFLQSAGEK